MRTVTPQAAAKLAQKLGTEPMLLVEVEWVDGGSILYSDQELEGAVPLIVSLGGFDTSMVLQGSGDSQSVDVTLDDTSGALKAIYLANDIHKRPASVYLLFKDLTVAHKILLFKGEIVTPVTWGDTDRTLSFSIMSELKEIPVGFSMEDGDFANIPEEALGKAWPLVFGQVCHMPVAQVRASRRGYLLQGTGIHDFTIPERMCQVTNVACPSISGGTKQVGTRSARGVWSVDDIETMVPDVECMDRRFGEICRFNWLLTEQMQYEQVDLDIYNGVSFPQSEPLTLYADGGALFEGSFNGNTFTVTRRQHSEYEQFREDNPNQRCKSLAEIEIEASRNTGTSGTIARAFNIDGKPASLSNVRTISNNTTGTPAGLANPVVMGTIPGVVSIWEASISADKAENFDFASCSNLEGVTEPGYYQCGRGIAVYISQTMINQHLLKQDTAPRSTWVPSGDGGYWINSAASLASLAIKDCDVALAGAVRPFDAPVETWKAFDDMQKVEFEWVPPGTDVYIEEESEELYTVSLLPGTVDRVAAYRTGANGRGYLTEVPADMYTVYTTNYTGYSVVEIGMNKQLTRYDGKRWTDDLYVSFTSTVGPNPCDIIQWLIEKYTDKTVDPTTFAAVHNYVSKYPCNFYLTDRVDVFELINQIAYQSRCSVYTRNDVVYITYLSREPDSLRTLTESDILSESFTETLSETEDVYTVHKINWQQSGAWIDDTREPSKQIILKYNIPKYGTVEDEWDYNCYNDFSLVLKSATFWLIRKANSWRKVQMKLPIKHIDLDVGDCVTLNVANFGAAIKTIVESISYEPDDNTLAVTLWTPIRSGETSQYFWAWPSQKATREVWPLPLDVQAGGGYTFTVTPPLGHILRGGVNRFDQVQMSSGDYHPSDLDDTLPTVNCLISDYTEFFEEDWEAPDIENKKLSQSAWRAPMQTRPTSGLTPFGGGGGGGGGSKKKKSPKKPPAPTPRNQPEPAKPGSGKSDEATEPPECETTMHITIHTSEGQGTNRVGIPGGCGGPCECSGGCPSCYGPVWVVTVVIANDLAAAAAAKAQALTLGGLTGGADGMTSGGGSKNARYGMYSEDGFVLETGAPEGGAGKSISGGWGCQETGVLHVSVYQSGSCVPAGDPTDTWGPLPDLKPGAYAEAASSV